MRGKAGLVIGLAAGYVLGTRAGRERYEQIKAQAQKVWNLDPVQNQVEKVTDFAKSSVAALPTALWDGAVKISKSIGKKDTPGQNLDAAIKASKEAAAKVKAGAGESADAVADKIDAVEDDLTGRGGA